MKNQEEEGMFIPKASNHLYNKEIRVNLNYESKHRRINSNTKKKGIREGWGDKFAIYVEEGEDELMIPDFVDYESENLL